MDSLTLLEKQFRGFEQPTPTDDSANFDNPFTEWGDDDIRYQREFGLGEYGCKSLQEYFGEKRVTRKPNTYEQLAREMGWSHACAIVDQVIKDYGEAWKQDFMVSTLNAEQPSEKTIREKGLELAIQRYEECNVVYGFIVNSLRQKIETETDINTLNRYQKLLQQLTRPILRFPDEPDGNHGKYFLPSSHEFQISPMSSPIGYALPRIAILMMGNRNDNGVCDSNKISTTEEEINNAIEKAESSIELMFIMAERAINLGVDPEEIIYHMLPYHKLEEENCRRLFNCIYDEMIRQEEGTPLYPNLANAYSSLLPGIMKLRGIVKLPIDISRGDNSEQIAGKELTKEEKVEILLGRCIFCPGNQESLSLEDQLAKLDEEMLLKLIELTSCKGVPVWAKKTHKDGPTLEFLLPTTTKTGKLKIQTIKESSPTSTPIITWLEYTGRGGMVSSQVSLEKDANFRIPGLSFDLDIKSQIFLAGPRSDPRFANLNFNEV